MPGIPYPLINGNRFDFSSVELRLGNPSTLFVGGVKEVTYSDSLEPGELRGNHAQLIGRTRGQYSAEASLTMFKQEFQQLVALLGAGYMEVSFDTVVSFSEQGSAVITDVLSGCRIKKAEDSGSEGGDPLTVKVDLHVMALIRNGVPPLNPLRMLR